MLPDASKLACCHVVANKDVRWNTLQRLCAVVRTPQGDLVVHRVFSHLPSDCLFMEIPSAASINDLDSKKHFCLTDVVGSCLWPLAGVCQACCWELQARWDRSRLPRDLHEGDRGNFDEARWHTSPRLSLTRDDMFFSVGETNQVCPRRRGPQPSCAIRVRH